jgi:hypothetical protein
MVWRLEIVVVRRLERLSSGVVARSGLLSCEQSCDVRAALLVHKREGFRGVKRGR